MAMSLKMLVEADAPLPGKAIVRTCTASSAVSTTAASSHSSASSVSDDCASDSEEFPALPSMGAPRQQSSGQKLIKASAWFSPCKVLKPTTVASTSECKTPLEEKKEEDEKRPEEEPPSSSGRPQATRLLAGCLPGRLDSQYPADMIVRNTFLDFASPTIQSMSSCRARSAEPLGRRKDEESEFLRPFSVRLPAAAMLAAAEVLEEGEEASPRRTIADGSTSGPVYRAVIDLSSALPLPVLGSAECPTAGSVAHAIGHCKPCAFFYKAGGCGNGVECPFCHLCDSNEKKRRQKERKASFQFKSPSLLQGK